MSALPWTSLTATSCTKVAAQAFPRMLSRSRRIEIVVILRTAAKMACSVACSGLHIARTRPSQPDTGDTCRSSYRPGSMRHLLEPAPLHMVCVCDEGIMRCDARQCANRVSNATDCWTWAAACKETHKSLNGSSFATPPRTMNTATAKFTMRLAKCQQIRHSLNGSRESFCLSFHVSATHKISEKSMVGELARCGNRSLTTGMRWKGEGWIIR